MAAMIRGGGPRGQGHGSPLELGISGQNFWKVAKSHFSYYVGGPPLDKNRSSAPGHDDKALVILIP